MDFNDQDENIRQWKFRKLVKSLESAKGNGTSMISLIINPRDQISRISKLLINEYGTASNIKSRVNRLSVLSAITSTQQRLKLYSRVPENGLIIYCGTVITEDHKEKMINIDFEPFRPINTSLYLCDNKFHTQILNELLESNEKFGFIILDGNGFLLGILSGNTRKIIYRDEVSLPNKHRKGGQSALRYSRLSMEKRHNYLMKVSEICTSQFIENNKPNISGLILAGSGDLKNELLGLNSFDQRLIPKIMKTIDTAYGGENGFNQAIDLASEVLGNVKFIQEKKLLLEYFDEISRNTGKYCFGVTDTFDALKMGAVKTLIVWDNLDINRYLVKNSENEIQELFLSDQKFDTSKLEIIEKTLLLEYLAENYQKFGTELKLVTDNSDLGLQFRKGFSGIGGLLRYPINFVEINDCDDFNLSDIDDDGI